MYQNLDVVEINKKTVQNSLWIVLMAVLLMLSIVGGMDFFSGWINESTGNFVSRGLRGILAGASVWLPTVLICLCFEWLMINERTSNRKLLLILLIELLIPVIIFLFVGSGGVDWSFQNGIILLSIACVAQGIRYGYLCYRSRMFNRVNYPNRKENN